MIIFEKIILGLIFDGLQVSLSKVKRSRRITSWTSTKHVFSYLHLIFNKIFKENFINILILVKIKKYL